MGVGLCIFSSIFIHRWDWRSPLHTQTLESGRKSPAKSNPSKSPTTATTTSPFKPQIRYKYQWEGQEFTGSKLTDSGDNRRSEYEDLVDAERKLSRRGTCYINPEKPEEAILERKITGAWFGLIFASVGSLFLVFGLSIFKNKKSKAVALSSKAKNNSDLKTGPVGYLFFGIFALVGTGIFLGLVAPTAKKYFAAKTWQPVEASVIWSTVRSHNSDDGTTYSPDIFYSYRFQNEPHRSNSYSLMSGSSSGRDSKQEIVDAYPRDHKFTCYVNPDKPWQAVVERKLGWFALFGLFPLPFMAIGFGGIWWMIFRSGKNDPASPNAVSARKNTPNHLSSTIPTASKPKGGGRWGKLFGHLFFALFWCGITSVFVVIAWKSWAKGEPEWFLTIFIIPFVLIGLFLVFSLPHTFLGIFSPRFDFDLRDPDLKPGLATKFRWKQSGGSGRLTEMTLTLVGQEQATYRRGTDRTTAHSTFYQKELFRTTHLPEMISNECDLIFPAEALPSFEGQHNKILWFLKIHGAVHRRPDVKEEIPLILQPLEPTDFR